LFQAIRKAGRQGHRRGCDGLILDLEDAVPVAMKAEAREVVAASIRKIAGGGKGVGVYVRLNALETGMTGDDLERIAITGLSGVLLPKNYGPRDIIACDALITHFERKNGVPPGSIEIVVSLETAQAYSQCEAILAASASGGDAFRRHRQGRRMCLVPSASSSRQPDMKRCTCGAALCWQCARAAAGSHGSDCGRTSRIRRARAPSPYRIARSVSPRW
jgi:citrate lyase beta subunit